MCATPLQICKALEAIWEFSDVMENYLDEKGKWLFVIHSKYLKSFVKPKLSRRSSTMERLLRTNLKQGHHASSFNPSRNVPVTCLQAFGYIHFPQTLSSLPPLWMVGIDDPDNTRGKNWPRPESFGASTIR